MDDSFGLAPLVVPMLVAAGGVLLARRHPAGLRVAIEGAIGVTLASVADAGQSIGMSSLLALVMATIVLAHAALAVADLQNPRTTDRAASALVLMWSLTGGLILFLAAGFWLFAGVDEPADFADPLAWLGAMLMPLPHAVPLWPWRGRRAGLAVLAAGAVLLVDTLLVGVFAPWRAAGLAVVVLWVISSSDGGRPRSTSGDDLMAVIVMGTGVALLTWTAICSGLLAYWLGVAGPA